jgi:hypothetical protein
MLQFHAVIIITIGLRRYSQNTRLRSASIARSAERYSAEAMGVKDLRPFSTPERWPAFFVTIRKAQSNTR